MDIVMGLVAALFWGGTDFLMGLNSRAVGVKTTVFFNQVLGFILMSTLLALYPTYFMKAMSAHTVSWILGCVAALFTATGALALSKAFSIGKSAIVAPLVASYGIFTTVLAWISGDTIVLSQFLGIAVCAAGVFLASANKSTNKAVKKENNSAIVYGLLAAFLFGTSFWLQGKYTLHTLGPITMLWLSYTVGLCAIIFTTLKHETILPPTMKSLGMITSSSLLNLGGFSAFSYGAISGSVSIVTVISTLSGGIAAVLGCILLKERLSPIQGLGISLVLTGAIVLHLFQ